MKEQLKGLEKDHGNVDLLSHRLSNVRIHGLMSLTKKLGRKFRLLGPAYKNIEDKLSDKLHDELTKVL